MMAQGGGLEGQQQQAGAGAQAQQRQTTANLQIGYRDNVHFEPSQNACYKDLKLFKV